MEVVDSILNLPLSLNPATIIVLSFIASLLIAYVLYKINTGQPNCCIAFYSLVALVFIPGILGSILGFYGLMLSTLAILTASIWSFYEAKEAKRAKTVVTATVVEEP